MAKRQIKKFPDAICATDHFHVKQEFGRKFDRVRIDTMNKYYSRKKYLEKKKDKTEAEVLELKEASKHYYVLKNSTGCSSPMTTEYSTQM